MLKDPVTFSPNLGLNDGSSAMPHYTENDAEPRDYSADRWLQKVADERLSKYVLSISICTLLGV